MSDQTSDDETPSPKPPGLGLLPSPSNTAAGLWLYLIIFGGGSLTLYYHRIHYLPDLQWEDALSELLILSVLGGLAWVLFGLLLFLPGAIWSEELIGDPALRSAMCVRHEDEPLVPCMPRVWKRLGLPFAAYVGLAQLGVLLPPTGFTVVCVIGFALALGLYLRELRADLGYQPGIPRWAPRLLTARRDWHRPPAGAAAVPAGEAGAALLPPRRRSAARHSHLWRALFWFAASLACGSLFLVIEVVLDGRQGPSNRWQEPSSGILALTCAVLVIGSNLAVAVRLRSRRTTALLISVIAGFVLLVAGEGLEGRNSLLTRTLASFGVGEDARVTLVLKPDTRELLEGLGIRHQVAACAGPHPMLVVSQVQMLSRLGASYFVRWHGRQFPLPKSEVASWWAATDPTILLRQPQGEVRIPLEAGVPWRHQLVYANANADAKIGDAEPTPELFARWDPSFPPVLVRLNQGRDRRVLCLSQDASNKTELSPTTAVKSNPEWLDQVDARRVTPAASLSVGQYGLWNPATGELAAFTWGTPAATKEPGGC